MPWRLARPVEDEVVGEARSVQCECCGIAEECTPTYIGRVRAHFHGKWVCGLCAEGVKERQQREPDLAVWSAVEAHAALCQRFNSTVRLNPKLSLASSMRDIARKSCQHRVTGDTSCTAGAGGNTSGTACCGAGRTARCPTSDDRPDMLTTIT